MPRPFRSYATLLLVGMLFLVTPGCAANDPATGDLTTAGELMWYLGRFLQIVGAILTIIGVLATIGGSAEGIAVAVVSVVIIIVGAYITPVVLKPASKPFTPPPNIPSTEPAPPPPPVEGTLEYALVKQKEMLDSVKKMRPKIAEYVKKVKADITEEQAKLTDPNLAGQKAILEGGIKQFEDSLKRLVETEQKILSLETVLNQKVKLLENEVNLNRTLKESQLGSEVLAIVRKNLTIPDQDANAGKISVFIDQLVKDYKLDVPPAAPTAPMSKQP